MSAPNKTDLKSDSEDEVCFVVPSSFAENFVHGDAPATLLYWGDNPYTCDRMSTPVGNQISTLGGSLMSSVTSSSASVHRGTAVAYVVFAFTLGMAWFVLAPLVPDLIHHLQSSLSSILLFVSLYGFAMIVFSLPAAWWAKKSGVSPVLRTAVLLSVVGLGVRIFSSSYALFFVAQAVAAIAYPFLISPVGAVLRQAGLVRWRAVTGLTIGLLFLGMSVGAFLGPRLASVFGLTGTLTFVFAVNLVAGIFLFATAGRLQQSAPDATSTATSRVVFGSPRWWWIGLAIAATSVMFGGIAVSALSHQHLSNAAALGSLLTALNFLGSAIGAILFAWLADTFGHPRAWLWTLLALTTIFTAMVTLALTGAWLTGPGVLKVVFFLLGLFGNGTYALALAATGAASREALGAGVQTAGFSMASNVGVALLPPLLGPLVLTQPTTFAIVTIGILVLALINLALVHKQSDRLTAT